MCPCVVPAGVERLRNSRLPQRVRPDQAGGCVMHAQSHWMNLAESRVDPYDGDRVRLLSLRIENKAAHADFGSELEAYGGGSANVCCIWPQIVSTAAQFPFIEDVKISIEGRTEDILQP